MIHRFSGSFINNHKEERAGFPPKLGSWEGGGNETEGSRGNKAGTLPGSSQHDAWTQMPFPALCCLACPGPLQSCGGVAGAVLLSLPSSDLSRLTSTCPARNREHSWNEPQTKAGLISLGTVPAKISRIRLQPGQLFQCRAAGRGHRSLPRLPRRP